MTADRIGDAGKVSGDGLAQVRPSLQVSDRTML